MDDTQDMAEAADEPGLTDDVEVPIEDALEQLAEVPGVLDADDEREHDR